MTSSAHLLSLDIPNTHSFAPLSGLPRQRLAFPLMVSRSFAYIAVVKVIYVVKLGRNTPGSSLLPCFVLRRYASS
jgi:hypothetical protein